MEDEQNSNDEASNQTTEEEEEEEDNSTTATDSAAATTTNTTTTGPAAAKLNAEDVIAAAPAAAAAAVAALYEKAKKQEKPSNRSGRKSSSIDEELFHKTLQELQKDGIIEDYTCMTVTCSLCQTSITLRTPYYLYHWKTHEKSIRHTKLLNLKKDNNLEQLKKEQDEYNAMKKRKADERERKKIKYDPNATTTEPCDGILPYYDNLERDLTICNLYCVEPDAYKIRENDNLTIKKNLFASDCPNGAVTYKHQKEQNRCNSCRTIRMKYHKFHDIKKRFKTRGETLTKIDNVIEKQHVEEQDLSYIRSFLAINSNWLTDFGKMRKHQCSQLVKHYRISKKEQQELDDIKNKNNNNNNKKKTVGTNNDDNNSKTKTTAASDDDDGDDSDEDDDSE